jgi:hypothetical protein
MAVALLMNEWLNPLYRRLCGSQNRSECYEEGENLACARNRTEDVELIGRLSCTDSLIIYLYSTKWRFCNRDELCVLYEVGAIFLSII